MRTKNNVTVVILEGLNLIGCAVSIANCFHTRNVPKSALVIPLLYTLLLYICRCNKRHIGLPGLFTLNIMMFFRYQVTFVSYFVNDYISRLSFVQKYYSIAIMVMCFEMVVTFASIGLFYSERVRIKIKGIGDRQKRNHQVPEYSTLESPKAVILSLVVLVVLVILAYTNRSLVGTTDILYGITSNAATEEVSGPIGILWQSLLVVIYLYYIFKYYLNYVKTGMKRYVLLTLVISIVYLVFIYICQRRISRWYLVVSFIASLFLFSKMYPKDVKGMLLTIGIPVGIILFTGTIYKTSSTLIGTGFRNQIENILNPTNCDAYFAGIGNITSAIDMSRRNHSTLANLIQDIINNMPYINSKFDTSFASVDIFNMFVGRTDQIIPCIGQGVFYFSTVFAPIVSIVNIAVLKKYDTLFNNNLNMKTFVYSFAAVFTGLIPCLNFTIFLSWLYIRIIPFTIMISLTETYLRSREIIQKGEIYGS